jgi:hypothetical protein
MNKDLFKLFERTPTNFKRLKEILTQEMTKMPILVNFADNIEIKYRERCNWSETVQMTWNARKEELS